MPVKSKVQARLMGAVAGGKKTKAHGMSKAQAREHLRGVKVHKLPARAFKPKARFKKP